MRETDISKFTGTDTEPKSDSGVKRLLKAVGRVLFTALMVMVSTGLVIFIALSVYIGGIAAEPTGINLKAKSMNQTSFIYVKNKKGEFKKYQSLYDTENRVWVDFDKIPDNMKNAMIAIEDRRFEEHHGVDFVRTMGAIFNLTSGQSSYGGSTLTQQLIKNISDDNEVSLNRKIREIVKALKLENEYTKDQILEAYLNVVNFGNNCQGVQAAANLYFGKGIEKCSLAQCAAIAGITQNPSRFNPLIYPEENKKRRDLVLSEMLDQGKITQQEYDEAKAESDKMKFVGYKKSNKATITKRVQNWYLDELQNDLTKDLATLYNISEKAASDMIFTEGLKIYCAMDLEAQEYLEKAAMEIDASYDTGLQCAATMIDFKGAIIATTGSSQEKTANLLFDRATDSVLQPGSSIKPVVVYPYAIEKKKLYYSSVVKDEPLESYRVDEYGNLVPGPNNWYGSYNGNMLLPDAIEWSANATAAQVMNMISPENAYKQAITLQGFEHLKEADKVNTGSLSIGGMQGGVTVREMAATYCYIGNGGKYYKPYTYYYVTDSEDNVIIDNRDTIPKESYSPETAYIMNRLLHYNMVYSQHTHAHLARVDGWDIAGKTGTTDSDKDSWFCGVSPYASMAVWTGFDQPDSISENGKNVASSLFSRVMGHYLEGRKQKEFKRPSTIIEANFNPSNGAVYNIGSATDGQYIGYYTEDNIPEDGYSEDYVDYYYDDSSYDDSGESDDAGLTDDNDASQVEIDVDTPTEAEDGGEEQPADEGGGEEPAPDEGGGEEPAPDEGGGDEEPQVDDNPADAE